MTCRKTDSWNRYFVIISKSESCADILVDHRASYKLRCFYLRDMYHVLRQVTLGQYVSELLMQNWHVLTMLSPS